MLLLFFNREERQDISIIFDLSMIEVQSIIPQINVSRTNAVVGTTSLTYNQSGITYNEVGQVYGGTDYKQEMGPTQLSMVNMNVKQMQVNVIGF